MADLQMSEACHTVFNVMEDPRGVELLMKLLLILAAWFYARLCVCDS